MKKIITISVLLLLFGNLIYAQGKIKQSEFQEKGSVINVQFMQTQKVTFTADNLKINIYPIDPSSLNDSLANAYYLSGAYNYTYIERSRKDYFLKRNRKRGLSPDQTNPVLLNIGLDWLMDNDLIDESDYSKLAEEIQSDFAQKEEGSNSFERATGSFNPFSIDAKYLSTFRITLINNTDVPIKFNNKIELLSNKNILKPLSQSEIISMLKVANSFNVPKMVNLGRYNLDSTLIIPAKSSAFKYFATLPIDNSSTSFEILYNDKDSQTSKWDISKTKQEINNKYTFYELEVYPTSWTYENIYVIVRNSNANAYVAGSKLYVDKDNIDKELSIFVYAIYEKKLFYFPFKFVPHKYLDLEKKRRERLPIDLIPIKL